MQTALATTFTYLASVSIFDIDSKAMLSLIISAIATGLAAVMPLFEDDEK